MATGWGWEQTLDELTAPRLAALREHWRMHPPVHKIVAAFCGYKPPPEKPEADPVRISTPDQARAFMAATGGRIEGVGHM